MKATNYTDLCKRQAELYKKGKPNVESKMREVPKDGKLNLDMIMKMVPREKTKLPFTPLVKGMLSDSDIEIPLNAPVQEFETLWVQWAYEFGIKYHGEPVYDYKDVDSSRYPDVDYWRNFLKMGREVTPGSTVRRLENLSKYVSEHTFKVDKAIFNKACSMVADLITTKTYSRDDWPNAKGTFAEHNSNVMWPFFANEKKIRKTSGLAYWKESQNLAKKLEVNEMFDIPALLIGRDQRAGFEMKIHKGKVTLIKPKDSKARVVYAVSRTENIIVAKISNPLIEQAKNWPLFSGFLSPEEFYEVLKRMERTADKMKLLIRNDDFQSFDTTVSAELIGAVESILVEKIGDARGRRILHEAMRSFVRKPIISNDVKKPMFKYGAIPSGHGLTNLVGGFANAIAKVYSMLKADKEYSRLFYKLLALGIPPLLVMGDDVLQIYNKTADYRVITKTLQEDLGMIVHPDKGEQGTFFLQTRVYKGNIYYPVPRVLSKLLWIERPKGLGPYGWTLANWSKLWQIRFNPGFEEVVAMVKKLDKYKLGTFEPSSNKELTLSEFRGRLIKEFAEYNKTPKDDLYDGDPNKADQWSQDGTPSSEYLNEMWKLVGGK